MVARRRLRRGGWIAAQALALGSIAVIAVAAFGPRTDDEGETHQLTYTLSWDTDGVDVATDGSFTVTTDLGYEVTITDGTLASYSATVVSCDDQADGTDTSDHATESASGFIDALAGVEDASANHGQTFEEQVEGPVVETIASATTVLGTTTVGADAYCDAHIAFAQVSAVGADEEELAAFATLELEGTVVAPDGSETPLSVATSLPWATKDELIGETGERLELAATDATVEVRRDLAALFDDVDFASLSGDDLDRALLRSIAGATSFVVTAGPASTVS